ncbi:pseudouridine synthase [Cerasicoccus arenae]|uniref:Pseudouridine synthase n=2 Tax=Cerasicoccus arenae TaxID=424488 RepID=A0A8J3GBS2_9BACT|nr:rRNA pseudouridine synthase [Cerasicoccus arenae]GHB92950.1 pseudouridine synthase [Cerasicoccus arenae]
MPEPEAIRLQKYLSEQGVCSRRKAETLIEEGVVTINGITAKLGDKVVSGKDIVKVEGQRVTAKAHRQWVILMNKPKGVICSHGDPHHSRTIYDLLPPELAKEKLICCGRLDKESEGMLILTNDGELAQRITHPSGGVVKRYRIKVSRPFDTSLIPKMIKGIHREGDFLQAKKIIVAPMGPDKDRRLEVHLGQGRKREIRRLFESFGYFVDKLERFQMGGLQMKRTPRGSVREIPKRELDFLFSK